MMKDTRSGMARLSRTVVCAVLLANAPLVLAAPTDAELLSLAARWGDALRSGDTVQLEAMSAGGLLADRRGLWRSGGFQEELQQTYGGATVTVEQIRKSATGASLVRIRVQFAGGLPMFRELTVSDIDGRGALRVVDDSPATD